MAKVFEYDGVVIGAGHNGMICASYLGKCGQKSMGVEKNMEVGGGLASHEDLVAARNAAADAKKTHQAARRKYTRTLGMRTSARPGYGIRHRAPAVPQDVAQAVTHGA